ncbi:MAG: transcriptional regulator, Crp/Fnr family [Phenylobacterium sp.]|nr:transcriptional regulator, Crp/Fnr family [Phenylobacterium sp.]
MVHPATPHTTPQTRQVAAALHAGGFLGALSGDACDRLAESGRAVDLAMGAVLSQAGDPGDAMFIVLEGELEVRTVSPGGRETRLVALGPGAVAGEMAALDGGLRSADMVASRRTRLWRIPRHALLETLRTAPEVALALLSELSARLRRTNSDLEVRATEDLGGRLARLLGREQGPRGLVALSQSELARRLGASREKVNRKLQGWVADGVVEVTPSGIRILSAEGLERRRAQASER